MDVIAYRKGEYLIDEKEAGKPLRDTVLVRPGGYYDAKSVMRLKNGVEIVWKTRDRYDKDNPISANYMGVEIYSTSSSDIFTVLSVINSFKDTTKEEVKEFLKEKTSSMEKRLIEKIEELKIEKESLESEISQLKKIKEAMIKLLKMIDDFLKPNSQ